MLPLGDEATPRKAGCYPASRGNPQVHGRDGRGRLAGVHGCVRLCEVGREAKGRCNERNTARAQHSLDGLPNGVAAGGKLRLSVCAGHQLGLQGPANANNPEVLTLRQFPIALNWTSKA